MSFALDAGVGFEPHDLRVMSPTSYQAALPCDISLLQGLLYHKKLILSTLFSLFVSKIFYALKLYAHFSLIIRTIFSFSENFIFCKNYLRFYLLSDIIGFDFYD